MCGRGKGRKSKKGGSGNDGFEEWGGYMAAKKAKLLEQFQNEKIEKISDIFAGVRILVNGLTHPSAPELKNLMAAHGGEYHIYQLSSTTHIIASNLPNVKIKHLGSVPVVKPAWITESIALNKLLDYKRYLLYSNQSRTQPALNFPIMSKPPATNKDCCSNGSTTSINVNEKALEESNYDENLTNKHITVTSTNSNTNPTSKITKTASDPQFLQEFYNNSRLHLIATLGAEFKQLVGYMREMSNRKFPGKDKLIKLHKSADELKTITPDSIVMHIDMDCFFVSVGLRNHPELRGQPVAITHARSGTISNMDPSRQASRAQEFALYQERLPEGAPSRVVDLTDRIDGLASMSEIASCSYEARRYGIKNGMFLGQAVKLCPELKTLPYDFEGYKEVSKTLYETVALYTLDIEAVSCDEMYVDVKQILKETGLTVEEWANHIRNEIMEITKCPCSTGFGANRLQARLATRKAKPAGQFYLRPGDVEQYMSDIPAADLPGVGRATLVKLQNIGLQTCGDIQSSSLRTLQLELGNKLGEKIREQAFGRDSKALDYNHERKSVSAEINYGIRFKTKDECYNFLQSLSGEVFSRLNEVKMRARGLTLKLLVRAEGAPMETAKFLGHGVCDAISKSSTSNCLYNSTDVIYKEARAIYDRLGVPFAELRGVGIQLTKLEKSAPINKSLANFLNQAKKEKDAQIEHSASCTNKDNQDRIVDKENERKRHNYSGITSTDVGVQTPKKSPVKVNVTKSKNRGRSKGIASKSKTKINLSGKDGGATMDMFLLKSKNRTNMNAKKEIPDNTEISRLHEQIDINVLNELPEDIRQEILNEYKIDLNRAVVPQITHQPPAVSRDVSSPKQPQKDIADVDPATTSTRPSPFINLTWEQIKPGIKAWIQSSPEPSSVDVDMLASHLRQLALTRQIEVLQCGFNFLHRTFSKLNCSWHDAYFLLVNAVQQGMVARYGKVLYVQTEFKCCQIH